MGLLCRGKFLQFKVTQCILSAPTLYTILVDLFSAADAQGSRLQNGSSLLPWLHSLLSCTVASPSFDFALSAARCLLQLCEASQVAHNHTDLSKPSWGQASVADDLLAETDTAPPEKPNQLLVMAYEKELAMLQRASYFEVQFSKE